MSAIINMFPLPKFKGKGFIIPKKRRLPRKTKKAMNKKILLYSRPKPYKADDEIKNFFKTLRGKSIVVNSIKTTSDGSLLYTFDF